MAIDRYYTPQALADATGLYVSQCRALILQSPDRLLISRNPNTKKPRYAISEKAFKELVEKNRRQVQAMELEKQTPPVRREKRKSVPLGGSPGLTPDGKIMTRKQMKEAGLWKEEKK